MSLSSPPSSYLQRLRARFLLRAAFATTSLVQGHTMRRRHRHKHFNALGRGLEVTSAELSPVEAPGETEVRSRSICMRYGWRHGLRDFDRVRTLYEKYTVQPTNSAAWIKYAGFDRIRTLYENSTPQTPQPGSSMPNWKHNSRTTAVW
ncbi:hypothetical protein EDB92DRAFT_1821649 [Lactarius akahatsu]|uniref:Uncharacterized protein n=1 Tax=Lactarius akahatsu TaxID=416441 RepID=A0AAD4L507_9AGAM|nr:hypothetical protein EDB92DRAFT_1821649 [Lactarius akahatsu]